MSGKISRRILAVLIELLSIAVLLIVLYLVYQWLSGISVILAYLGNLLIIILVLLADELTLRQLNSQESFLKGKTKAEREKAYRTLQKSLSNLVSFKTDLYLIYVFVLIASQILTLYPSLASEQVGSFVHANNYSILLLIALDMLSKQFSQDRKKSKELLVAIEKTLSEENDSPTDAD